MSYSAFAIRRLATGTVIGCLVSVRNIAMSSLLPLASGIWASEFSGPMHESCQAVAWRFHRFQTSFRVLSVTRRTFGTWSTNDAQLLPIHDCSSRSSWFETVCFLERRYREQCLEVRSTLPLVEVLCPPRALLGETRGQERCWTTQEETAKFSYMGIIL